MPIGEVNWVNPTKGFGSIRPVGGTKDVFVHISAVQTARMWNLSDNQKVSYEVKNERGKEAAGNLKLL